MGHPSDARFYVEQILNLLLALVGLLWVWGADEKRVDLLARRGWQLFWAGTAAYYAAAAANGPRGPLEWWVPQIGLYFASVALLSTYLLGERRLDEWSPRSVVALAAGTVLVAAGADITTVKVFGIPALWHQALTCFVILPWAFRLRHTQPSRSIAMALYALIQLPLWQTFPPLQSLWTFEQFLHNTFAAYLLGKVPLVSAVHFAIRRPDSDSPATQTRNGPPSPDGSSHPAVSADERWDVFISYAFEDVKEARTARLALLALGTRAFVASDDLALRVRSAEWGEAIDKVLDSVSVLTVLISPEALSSRWVSYEWRSLHNDILDGRDATIVPICLREVRPRQLPRALRRYLAFDATDSDRRDAYPAAIAAALASLRAPPSARNSDRDSAPD